LYEKKSNGRLKKKFNLLKYFVNKRPLTDIFQFLINSDFYPSGKKFGQLNFGEFKKKKNIDSPSVAIIKIRLPVQTRVSYEQREHIRTDLPMSITSIIRTTTIDRATRIRRFDDVNASPSTFYSPPTLSSTLYNIVISSTDYSMCVQKGPCRPVIVYNTEKKHA